MPGSGVRAPLREGASFYCRFAFARNKYKVAGVPPDLRVTESAAGFALGQQSPACVFKRTVIHQKLRGIVPQLLCMVLPYLQVKSGVIQQGEQEVFYEHPVKTERGGVCLILCALGIDALMVDEFLGLYAVFSSSFHIGLKDVEVGYGERSSGLEHAQLMQQFFLPRHKENAHPLKPRERRVRNQEPARRILQN